MRSSTPKTDIDSDSPKNSNSNSQEDHQLDYNNEGLKKQTSTCRKFFNIVLGFFFASRTDVSNTPKIANYNEELLYRLTHAPKLPIGPVP